MALHSLKVHNASCLMRTCGTVPCTYQQGVVFLPDGIVSVYRQREVNPHVRLDFVWNGRVYDCSHSGEVDDRKLMRLARQFVREVMQAWR